LERCPGSSAVAEKKEASLILAGPLSSRVIGQPHKNQKARHELERIAFGAVMKAARLWRAFITFSLRKYDNLMARIDV
jgi:hypothetical protein